MDRRNRCSFYRLSRRRICSVHIIRAVFCFNRRSGARHDWKRDSNGRRRWWSPSWWAFFIVWSLVLLLVSEKHIPCRRRDRRWGSPRGVHGSPAFRSMRTRKRRWDCTMSSGRRAWYRGWRFVRTVPSDCAIVKARFTSVRFECILVFCTRCDVCVVVSFILALALVGLADVR